jgi:hypothetical protein
MSASSPELLTVAVTERAADSRPSSESSETTRSRARGSGAFRIRPDAIEY